MRFAGPRAKEESTLNVKPEQTGCAVTEGTLPGTCAPMVFPFIAMQTENSERYDSSEALKSGTLFPGLNLPFHVEMQSWDFIWIPTPMTAKRWSFLIPISNWRSRAARNMRPCMARWLRNMFPKTGNTPGSMIRGPGKSLREGRSNVCL